MSLFIPNLGYPASAYASTEDNGLPASSLSCNLCILVKDYQVEHYGHRSQEVTGQFVRSLRADLKKEVRSTLDQKEGIHTIAGIRWSPPAQLLIRPLPA